MLSTVCCGGVGDTTRLVGASGLHGTEWKTSGDLEVVCNEAVQSRGRGPGVHITPLFFLRRASGRLKYVKVSTWGNRATVNRLAS